jgi:hypothetical protein
MICVGDRVRVIAPNKDLPHHHSGWGNVEDVDGAEDYLFYVHFDGLDDRDSAWFREDEIEVYLTQRVSR